MENREIVNQVEKLLDIHFEFFFHEEKVKEPINIEEVSFELYDTCNSLRSLFTEKYLDHNEEFLFKIKSILEQDLNHWKDIVNKDLIKNINISFQAKNVVVKKEDFKRLIEMKVFYISGLVEHLNSLIKKSEPVFDLKLSNKLSKVDLIRILNAMFELRFFEKPNGLQPNKKEIMEAFGEFLNVDLSSNSSHFNQALAQPLEVNLQVFEEMKKAIQKLHYGKEK
jgi:uncharacterized HAD superfamily protein